MSSRAIVQACPPKRKSPNSNVKQEETAAATSAESTVTQLERKKTSLLESKEALKQQAKQIGAKNTSLSDTIRELSAQLKRQTIQLEKREREIEMLSSACKNYNSKRTGGSRRKRGTRTRNVQKSSNVPIPKATLTTTTTTSKTAIEYESSECADESRGMIVESKNPIESQHFEPINVQQQAAGAGNSVSIDSAPAPSSDFAAAPPAQATTSSEPAEEASSGQHQIVTKQQLQQQQQQQQQQQRQPQQQLVLATTWDGLMQQAREHFNIPSSGEATKPMSQEEMSRTLNELKQSSRQLNDALLKRSQEAEIDQLLRQANHQSDEQIAAKLTSLHEKHARQTQSFLDFRRQLQEEEDEAVRRSEERIRREQDELQREQEALQRSWERRDQTLREERRRWDETHRLAPIVVRRRFKHWADAG